MSDCSREAEDVNHVLRHCYRAKQVWLQVLSSVQLQSFYDTSFEDWFDAKIRSNRNHWNILFAVICWVLWKRRCVFVLNGGVNLWPMWLPIAFNYVRI
ncbi:hypothetical protein V6N11_018667 [Hibiscus sabdariffa]|uniref:Reverse transcriptase zinc-binding domain-containing protein n=1 Tax=Hibiscus sabdariffa TaxID=183260 RepID=A0ABR2QSV7_9ROSI